MFAFVLVSYKRLTHNDKLTMQSESNTLRHVRMPGTHAHSRVYSVRFVTFVRSSRTKQVLQAARQKKSEVIYSLSTNSFTKTLGPPIVIWTNRERGTRMLSARGKGGGGTSRDVGTLARNTAYTYFFGTKLLFFRRTKLTPTGPA